MNLENKISFEEFLNSAIRFCRVSEKIGDGWKLFEDSKEIHKSYIRKDTFISHEGDHGSVLYKAELVIFYNLSYGVPSFSFNIWNSSGVLLTLDDIRQMSFINIEKEDFYSVLTQQEHPLFYRPYFIMHPCHTATLLTSFINVSKNIIVTFLSLITPLLRFNMPLDYGL